VRHALRALAGLLAGLSASGGAAAAQELPLGDGRIASQPQVGSVFACQTRFMGGGALGEGPWIHGGRWEPARKPIVQGAVAWPNAQLAITREGDRRVIRANDLPSHPTGSFPIRPDDPAFRYDRNPNAIAPQTIVLSLPAEPVPAPRPSCVPMGMIGIALSGVAIFNALDAEGRDAPAHEIQDRCNGHPERGGRYHYHDLSPCLRDDAGAAGRHSDLIGYALDGFGIYGRFGEGGKPLGNADLDACHGHSHALSWNGRSAVIYHYHVTREYPYTIGCFRGSVERAAAGPGAPPRAEPDRAAILQRAAETLGIPPERLRAALGPPPPDFARAARQLGIDEQRLRQAFPPPPGPPR